MEKLIQLYKKKKRNVIGIMSGTSLNGVDVALLEIEGSGVNTKINMIGFLEYKFPEGLDRAILKNSVRESSNVEEISQLNFLLPKIYVEAIHSLCDELNFSLEDVDLIGSHGQTIHHLPEKTGWFGYEISSTLQIGDPSVIAKLTNTITVGNFRTGDVALGGQGAPLIPYFDYIIFHSNNFNRALLNIGGISNITVLEKNGTQDDVVAFDTGPGNMMIDTLTKRFFNKNFDEDGKIAESGKFNEKLFDALVNKDTFIEKMPPKSTGREYYGDEFLIDLLQKYDNIQPEDWLNTITKFTAYGIYRNYEKFVKENVEIDELIISGGGAKNKFLYRCIHEYFGDDIDIKIIDQIGVSADAKEAICFAVLANETINGVPTNIPRVTGASRPTILGKICLP